MFSVMTKEERREGTEVWEKSRLYIEDRSSMEEYNWVPRIEV